MASKTGIFSYGQKKRKVDHTDFDMGFNSLTTDSFGQLKVKACLETLADDFWNIGHNTLTKVKPMVSPAMTRIHQNWYAFYCSNHKVWEHWDDYITNGTAYGRVYGSNATNQKLDNPWKVPQIMAPDLMLPCKIASGFALPIRRYRIFAEKWDILFPFFKFEALQSSLHNFDVPTSDYDLFFKNRITDLVALLFTKTIFPNIPYLEAYYDGHSVIMDFYLDPPDLTRFSQLLGLTLPTQVSEDLDVGHDIDPSAGTAEEYLEYQTFRFFSDSQSSDVSASNSPFVLQKRISNSYYNGIDLNYYSYSQRRDLDNYFPAHENNITDAALYFVGIDSRFFGKRYHVNYVNDQLYFWNYDYRPGLSNVYWRVDMSIFGFAAGQHSIDEILDFMRTIPGYLGVTTDSWDDMLDNRVSTGLSLTSLTSDRGVVSNNNDLFLQTEVYQHKLDQSLPTYFADLPCDLLLPISVNNSFIDPFPRKYRHNTYYMESQSNSTDSLGYYSKDWLIYLCRQTLILLDDFDLPIDPLCVRNTLDYRYESFNALPFFAYSNIWEYHFRNQVVSSPELDYRKTNGFMFLSDSRRYSLNLDYHRPSQLPEIWQDVDFMNMPSEGWVLPFSYLPKNSQASKFTAISTSDASYRHFVDGKNHYFNVYNYVDVFSILTGASLDLIVLNQTYHNYINHFGELGQLDYRTFATLYQNDFYLPNYYNGLLHLKYQNFNKDYFTSAMLDPMSGANQVELGDTINELRVNEAKQSWFEKIAQNRSVKKFMEAIFGITPMREEKEAVLLGSDHVDINIGEVIQTSQTDQTPQGTRSGLGSAHENGSLVHSHCNEHGFILILCSHTIESQYSQGISRHWLPKASYMDYPTQDFAHVGNESILQKEINYSVQPSMAFRKYDLHSYSRKFQGEFEYPDLSVYERNFNGRQKYQGTGNPYMFHTINNQAQIFQLWRNQAKTAGTSLDNVFGYTPRWSYYKFNLDQLHGEMRTKLQDWQTFRKFFSQPILSHEFVNWELTADSDELNRIFAVTDDFIEDKFILDIFINAKVNRALDYVCVPMSK